MAIDSEPKMDKKNIYTQLRKYKWGITQFFFTKSIKVLGCLKNGKEGQELFIYLISFKLPQDMSIKKKPEKQLHIIFFLMVFFKIFDCKIIQVVYF